MKNENYDDNENSMTAEEFLDFMRKNRRTVPNEKRIANKDKFIWAVSELSETYEIDADLIEDDDGYTASLYMNYASYNGYIKKLLGLIFILSDDFSVFEAKDNRDSDLLMCFTYSLKPETVCIFIYGSCVAPFRRAVFFTPSIILLCREVNPDTHCIAEKQNEDSF